MANAIGFMLGLVCLVLVLSVLSLVWNNMKDVKISSTRLMVLGVELTVVGGVLVINFEDDSLFGAIGWSLILIGLGITLMKCFEKE